MTILLRISLSVILTVGSIFFVTGCGGTKTYPLTGHVTFDGKPVPRGMITFLPKTDQTDAGSYAMAVIKEGNYKIEKGKLGLVGGTYSVIVTGTNGVAEEFHPEGIPLFADYRMEFIFSQEMLQFDIEIPVSQKFKKR
ncbi:MAG: hypothetical protein LBC02_07360 [Planctomycetaceae bacterium]|jgi:hypothetical protein|nr:hypothetical protein [Planctomycetaceae bacterium]